MKKVMNYFNKLKTKSLMKYMANEEGLVAIEYALIGFLIAVTIVAAVTAIGIRVNEVFAAILAALS
jgi:Flp pilus assembly pilin Flp